MNKKVPKYDEPRIFSAIRNKSEEYYSSVQDYDINVVDELEQNMLHQAIAWGELDIASDLINRGINIDKQDKVGLTPLHYAANHNNLELTTLLIKYGANINLRDVHGNNALWTAVFNVNDNYDLVQALVNAGADITTKNNHGRSPLDFAKQINDVALINILERKNV